MLDGFRLVLNDREEFEKKIVSDQLLEFRSSFNGRTGEVFNGKKGEWKGLKFSVTDKEANIEGSLHKFFNKLILDESQNYDDFGLSRISDALTAMRFVFGKSIDEANVTMLEMGFNLVIDESAEKLLKEKILMYRFVSHNLMTTYEGKGFAKEFRRSDYRWKLYDKATQSDLSYNVLRVELKFTGRRVLSRYGINFPTDLLDVDKLCALYNFFLHEFMQMMMIDNFGEFLSMSDKQYFTSITNPNYWIDLKNQNLTDKVIDLRKIKAVEFLKKKNLQNTHQLLMKMLNDKFLLLLNS